MNLSEPPAAGQQSPSPFLVGRDSRGRWVVCQQNGKCGGLFVDRSAAIHFAMFENGRHPENIVIVPDVLELDTQGGSSPAETRQRAA